MSLLAANRPIITRWKCQHLQINPELVGGQRQLSHCKRCKKYFCQACVLDGIKDDTTMCSAFTKCRNCATQNVPLNHFGSSFDSNGYLCVPCSNVSLEPLVGVCMIDDCHNTFVKKRVELLNDRCFNCKRMVCPQHKIIGHCSDGKWFCHVCTVKIYCDMKIIFAKGASVMKEWTCPHTTFEAPNPDSAYKKDACEECSKEFFSQPQWI